MTSGRWVSSYLQRAWSENDLLPIFLQVIKDAGRVRDRQPRLPADVRVDEAGPHDVGKLWQHLFVELYGELSENCRQHVGHILEHGCLASRILKRTGRTPSHDDLVRVYRELADCLQEDRQLV
jgi:hypothetical protein